MKSITHALSILLFGFLCIGSLAVHGQTSAPTNPPLKKTVGGEQSAARANDLSELRRLHKQHQTAHLTYDAELFVGSFKEKVTQLQRGYVATKTKAENLARFKKYFASYKFIEWNDIKPPVFNISKDGTLATVIVEKRVRGTYKNEKGEEEQDHSIFAWLEVWEKIDGKWKIAIVASTARDGK